VVLSKKISRLVLRRRKKKIFDHHQVCWKNAFLVLCPARRTEKFGPSFSWRKKIK
jgi:hypothetical protein